MAVHDRLLSKVAPEPNSGCWLWTASVYRTGYGRLLVRSRRDGRKRSESAHRVSYELHCGPIPEGMYVCHKCDVKSCVNPDHLFLGTHDDNMADKARKGRAPRGEGNSQSVLTESDVRRIRELAAGGMRYQDITTQFGVKRSQVGNIVRRQKWAHVA